MAGKTPLASGEAMRSSRILGAICLFTFVLVALTGPGTSARAADTVVDVTRLMSSGTGSSLRFYDQNARLMLSDVGLVFRPDGDHNTVAEVVNADSGDVVATVAFFPDYLWSDSVFAAVRPQGPGVVDLPGAGNYQLHFLVNGEIATTFPFEVVAEESDDPFDPDTKFHYRGPWDDFVFLKTSRTFEDHPVEVVFWTSALDLPSPDGSGELMMMLYKDGELLARNKNAKIVHKGSNLYGQFAMTLHEPVDNPNAAGFPMERLLGEDATYSLVMEIDGTAVRTFPIIVSGGAIVASPRSEPGYEPRDGYLAPRWFDFDEGSVPSTAAEEIFWLEAN